MFRPARMVRMAIVAPSHRQREVIEVLHAARVFHFEEYTEGRHPDLKLGQPLDEASKASERLVRLRALLRHLGVDEAAPVQRTYTSTEVLAQIDGLLSSLESSVGAAVEARDRVARDLEARVTERGILLPLTDLGLALDDFHGYDSVKLFLGEVDHEAAQAVRAVTHRAGVFVGKEAMAIFVPKADAERAAEVLQAAGFKDFAAPTGAGQIPHAIRRIDAEVKELESKLEHARAELVLLRAKHADFLLAAEEDLAIETDKAEAPLSFGHTERAFVVDTWVPVESQGELKAKLEAATDNAVHIEILDAGERDAHHRDVEPPVAYNHPKGIGAYSFFMDLFSRPKYNELDPTFILFLLFPFFFGFMVGDIGYGLIMASLGFFMMVRLGKASPAALGLGTGLFMGGIWATLFGLIVFHDAFGIPFVAHGDGLGWLTFHGREGLLGVATTDNSWLAHPWIEKLGSEEPTEFGHGEPLGVKAMLGFSIVAAFIHLGLGFIFGIINEFNHSKKHTLAKVGWLFVLVAFFVIIQSAMPENAISTLVLDLMGVEAGTTPLWALISLGIGLVLLVATEGPIGGFESLGLLAHTISYTRLAGVAVAKAAMAVAFNGLFLQDMVLHGAGVMVVIGIVLFILAQLLVLVLGMLSAGIQAIRLNYVEFFLKFYGGGGTAFAPFGRERKYSHAATQQI